MKKMSATSRHREPALVGEWDRQMACLLQVEEVPEGWPGPLGDGFQEPNEL